jgi:hypothetical protein
MVTPLRFNRTVGLVRFLPTKDAIKGGDAQQRIYAFVHDTIMLLDGVAGHLHDWRFSLADGLTLGAVTLENDSAVISDPKLDSKLRILIHDGGDAPFTLYKESYPANCVVVNHTIPTIQGRFFVSSLFLSIHRILSRAGRRGLWLIAPRARLQSISQAQVWWWTHSRPDPMELIQSIGPSNRMVPHARHPPRHP